MSTNKPETARPWQIGIRGILLFTAGMALSIGLFRASYVQDWNVGFATALLGLICLGATVGGLIGRLSVGSPLATEKGVAIGAACGLGFPCSFPLLLIAGLSMILIAIFEHLAPINADPEQ